MKYFFPILFFPAFAVGEPVKLTADEVRALLTGRTAIGHWVDHDYRQWFTDSGSTIYAPRHGRSSWGRWRVDDRTGNYESEWNQSGYWAAFAVLKDGDKFFWASDETPPQEFQMLEGEQLVWPKE